MAAATVQRLVRPFGGATAERMTLRIAIWHNLPSGGAMRAVHDHVVGLVRRGHAVRVWTPPTAENTFMTLTGIAPVSEIPLRRMRTSELRFPVRRLRLTHVMRKNLVHLASHCRQVADDMQRWRPDVVLVGSCQFHTVAPLGGMFGFPTVLYIQEHDRALFDHLHWLAPTTGDRGWGRFDAHSRLSAARLSASAQRSNAARYDRLLANSAFSAEGQLRAYGIRPEICYLGVDTQRFRPAPGDARERLVLGLGELAPRKNAHLLVEAVSHLDPPDRTLVWVANRVKQPYGSEVAALARRFGVTFDLRVNAPDAELLALLQKAAVMAYVPTLEPFGLAVLEAQACGLPVVASNEGGPREAVSDGETGLLVTPRPQAMADGLRRVLGDPALAQSLAGAAVERVHTYWTAGLAAERLEQQLIDTLDQNTPAA